MDKKPGKKEPYYGCFPPKCGDACGRIGSVQSVGKLDPCICELLASKRRASKLAKDKLNEPETIWTHYMLRVESFISDVAFQRSYPVWRILRFRVHVQWANIESHPKDTDETVTANMKPLVFVLLQWIKLAQKFTPMSQAGFSKGLSSRQQIEKNKSDR